MNTSRLLYRTRQFWQAISTRSSQVDFELVSSILSPSQMALFLQMQTSEQSHSQRVFRELIINGEANTDLQIAALLHDVGKTRAPLRLWERVLVVLVKSICPGCVHKWGQLPIGGMTSEMGWRRPFVISVQHPSWGAELADQCGSSQMVIGLIARHQEHLNPSQEDGISLQDRLLLKLQAADGVS
jgi:putative nucleotidyltransferase with HDIG domain